VPDFSSVSKFTGEKANKFFQERKKQSFIAYADILPFFLNMRLDKLKENLRILPKRPK